MRSIGPHLVANRFVPLIAAEHVDLATGDRVWLRQVHLDRVAGAGLSDVAARLFAMWHPCMAPLIDFGWLGPDCWFEAFACSAPRPARANAQMAERVAHVRAFLRLSDLELQLGVAPDGGAGTVVPYLAPFTDHLPTVEADDVGGGCSIGVHLVRRPLVARLIGMLEEPWPERLRVWSVDAPAGSGWRTCWRRLAREARLRGVIPVNARLLSHLLPGVDGPQRSWLAALSRATLLVQADAAAWAAEDRSALAQMLVRLTSADPARVLVLDVVREGRPSRAELVLADMAPEMLVGSISLSTGCRARGVPLPALARAARGRPGAFVRAVIATLSGRMDATVHERPPAYDGVSSGTQCRELPGELRALVQRADALRHAGRHTRAARLLLGEAARLRRRALHPLAAALTAHLAVAWATRGRLEESHRLWQRSCAEGVELDRDLLVPLACELAEQWMRHAWFARAEMLLCALSHDAGPQRSLEASLVRAHLIVCLCWQARWQDAWNLSAGDDRPAVRAAAAWALINLGRPTDAVAEIAAAEIGSAGRSGRIDDLIRAMRLRVALTLGVLHEHDTPAATPPERAAHHGTLAGDDLLLLRAEGTVRHRHALSAECRALMVRLTARSVPRLARARARLLLALSGAPDPPALARIAADVERVALATGARALCPGHPAMLPWPAAVDRRSSMLADVVLVLRLCQEGREPRRTLADVVRLLARRLRAGIVAIHASDEDRIWPLVQEGEADLRELARRVVSLRQPIVEADDGRGRVCAVPVMFMGDPAGAIVALRAAPALDEPDADRALLEAVALVVGPMLRGLVEQERTAQLDQDSGVLGTSSAIATLRRDMAAASRVPFTVLIEGESGVGKELVAREIHRRSARRHRGFCAINCAALTDELCEAELFGHARGAFTGAVGERAGLFEDADGGTLFLDEASELSPRAQAKLLRAIQEGEIRRLGETRSRKVDVRLIAATNRPLADAVAAGAFRADLRYRLDVIHLVVPPLRERPDDIALLARHFWRSASERAGTAALLGRDTLAMLARYHWPGNVRELQNVIAAMAAAAPARGTVTPALLPQTMTGAAADVRLTLEQARRHVDERIVRAALAQAGGHRGQAARALGVSRQGLAKIVDRLKLDPPHA